MVIFQVQGMNAFAQEDRIVRGIIDIHSNIGDGLYPHEKIAKLAQEKGFLVLIFGDSALRKWEYGVWPLRNLIKKTYEENSVLRLGIGKYLKKLTALQKNFSDSVLIPGLEASPFFYWEGSPFSKNLSLIDYYKQFLIIGIDREDYQNLPLVGNRRFFYFSKKCFLDLWPILIIILGLRLLKKKLWRISFIITGFIFLLNNLPFSTARFNVYQGYQGVEPYQDLINFVNKRGGLVFWAHPQMLSQKRYFGIETYTASHSEEMLLTHDYAGFGVSASSQLDIIDPDSLWDKILLEYIHGIRKKPVWIIGTLHYTKPPEKIDYVETLFFVKKITQASIMDALRGGRMYVRFNLGNQPVVLEEFSAKRLNPEAIQIIIRGVQIPSQEPLKIELIRNGKVFKRFEEERNEWAIIAEDNLSAGEKKAYYRLKITGSQTLLLSNPIFIEMP